MVVWYKSQLVSVHYEGLVFTVHCLLDLRVRNHLHDPELVRNAFKGIPHFTIPLEKAKLGVF